MPIFVSLKATIQDMKDTPLDQQCRIFADEQLEGSRPLSDYNIYHYYNIQEEFAPHQASPSRRRRIFAMTLLGKTDTLDGEARDTIDHVKTNTQYAGAIPPDQPHLFSEGQQLEDGRTLLDYNVREEFTLHRAARLHGGTRIFVQTLPGQMPTLCVVTDSPLDTVTANIRNNEGPSPDQRRLIFAGQQLEHGHTLSDYNIQNIQKGSTPHLVWRLCGGAQIFVSMMTDKSITLNVEVSDTIGGEKAKIQGDDGDTIDSLQAELQDMEDNAVDTTCTLANVMDKIHCSAEANGAFGTIDHE